MAKLNKTVLAALMAIQTSGRVTSEVGKPLLEQGLIEVNTADIVDGMAAARLTQKAIDSLPKAKAAPSASQAASSFEIITNAVPPESRKGKGREAGPSKYPFDSLQLNQSFFVANTEDMPNAVKTLQSALSNAMNKHRVAVMENGQPKTEMVTRTKRGADHKAMVDAEGKKVKETVSVPVYNYPVKFIIRAVKAQQACGEWVAPADGALITRTV